MKIRKATSGDLEQVWEIFREVIKTGDTYVFDPETPRQDLEKHWFAPYMHTYVLEEGEKIFGTYILKPNQIDQGAHVANGSYMVHPAGRGKGYGKAMGLHSLGEAKKIGFRAIQFNMIVSTNTIAFELWRKIGFEVIGTVPEAFNHKTEGFVDAYIMYKKIS